MRFSSQQGTLGHSTSFKSVSLDVHFQCQTISSSKAVEHWKETFRMSKMDLWIGSCDMFSHVSWRTSFDLLMVFCWIKLGRKSVKFKEAQHKSYRFSLNILVENLSDFLWDFPCDLSTLFGIRPARHIVIDSVDRPTMAPETCLERLCLSCRSIILSSLLDAASLSSEMKLTSYLAGVKEFVCEFVDTLGARL